METKYCKKCNQWKPVTAFYKSTRGGCIDCVRQYQNKWHTEHRILKEKETIPDGFLKCSVCHELKIVNEFYRNRSSTSGYSHRCKKCDNELSRARKQKQKEIRLSLKEQLPDGLKRCNKCKLVFPLSEYRVTPNGTCTSPCKNCIKEYRQQNKDRAKEKHREWRNNPENRDKENAKKKRWRSNSDNYAREKIYRQEYQKRSYVIEKNRQHNLNYRNRPENQAKARAKTIEWRKKNLDRSKYQTEIKRARKLNAKGSYTFEQWEKLLLFFDCCPCCYKQNILTVDHIIPLSKGGTNYIDNLQPLCRSCNSSKNAYLIIDYRPRKVREWAYLETYGTLDCTESQTVL